MADEITVKAEEIEIEGGRKMHIFTFDENGEPMPEMKPSDIVKDASNPEAKGSAG